MRTASHDSAHSNPNERPTCIKHLLHNEILKVIEFKFKVPEDRYHLNKRLIGHSLDI